MSPIKTSATQDVNNQLESNIRQWSRNTIFLFLSFVWTFLPVPAQLSNNCSTQFSWQNMRNRNTLHFWSFKRTKLQNNVTKIVFYWAHIYSDSIFSFENKISKIYHCYNVFCHKITVHALYLRMCCYINKTTKYKYIHF